MYNYVYIIQNHLKLFSILKDLTGLYQSMYFNPPAEDSFDKTLSSYSRDTDADPVRLAN